MIKNKYKLLSLRIAIFVVALVLSFGEVAFAAPTYLDKITYSISGSIVATGTHGLMLGPGANPDIYVNADIVDGVNSYLQLIKYNNDGSQAWNRIYLGDEIIVDEGGVAVDAAGNVFGSSTTTTGGFDFLLVKYLNNGTFSVVNRTSTAVFDISSGLNIGGDGYIYASGYTSNGSDLDFHIIKYDTNGSLVQNFYYDSGFEDRAYGTVSDAAGNVFVVGRSDNAAGKSQIRVVRFNPNGTLFSTNFYGGTPKNEIGVDIAIDISGIYVTGYQDTGANTDIYNIKYPLDLSAPIWNKTYDEGTKNISHGITLDSFSNVYVSGTSRDGGANHLLTLKYDSSGNEQWDVADNALLGLGGVDLIGQYLRVDSAGIIYNAGQDDLGAGPLASNIYIARYSQAAANTPPTVSGLLTNKNSINYCSATGSPESIILSWNFNDPEDAINQTSYRLEITRSDGAGYDSGIVAGLAGKSKSMTGLSINSSVPGFIRYNTSGAETYAWEVTVYDSAGASDGPDSGPSFWFPKHQYPEIGFTPPEFGKTASFLVNSPIDFKVSLNANTLKDDTKCYPAGDNTDCKKWEWDFDYDGTLSIDKTISNTNGNINNGNTTNSYSLPNSSYDVVLRVTDNDDYTCSNIGNPETIGATRPKWKEVVPE